MTNARRHFESLLSHADIRLDGDRPWDIRVHNPETFRRTLVHGSLGFGEAYMDGWWDCDDLDAMLTRVFQAKLNEKVGVVSTAASALKARATNPWRKSKAHEIGEVHYDIGNDLYRAMLDKRMVYTCGYWKDADNLDDAQEAKLDLVCRKIGLQKGMTVLDIGGGWGSFAKFAAEKYGAKTVAITVSKEQVALGRELCQGLPVEIRLQDYRDVEGSFDRVVSLGMFEHVGYKNYRTFMNVVHRVLKDEGLFLLHTIGANRSRKSNNPWVDKYIFPNSMLPSIAQIARAIEKRFVMEDWHNFGNDYVTTLHAWYDNIEAAWQTLDTDRYNERFRRMWRFYLLSMSAAFRTRNNQLWQIVLSKEGVQDGYTSVR